MARHPWGHYDPDWYRFSIPDPDRAAKKKPFRCDTCGKRFATEVGREDHALDVHGDREAAGALWPARKQQRQPR